MSNAQWVSIKERQPAPGSRVLATDGTVVCEASVHKDGHWLRMYRAVWCGEFRSKVTHWMPMPEPPEKESEGRRVAR